MNPPAAEQRPGESRSNAAAAAAAAAAPATAGAGAIVFAAVLDVVLVVAFALTGRSSHAEALDLGGLWGTAWPFLAGAALGWLAIRAWRAPLAVWPTGVAVWGASVFFGMLLRVLTGQGTAFAFIVVATLTLALLLVGWRAIAALILRLRRRKAGPEASAHTAESADSEASGSTSP